MTIAMWMRERVAPRLYWGIYLWIALLPVQLPLERVLGLRLALSDVALAATLLAAFTCWLAGPRRLARARWPRTSLNCALTVLVAVFVMGLLVAWVRTGVVTSYVLLNKGAGLLLLIAAFFTVVVLMNTPERLHRAAGTLIGAVGLVNAMSLVLYGVWVQWGWRTLVIHGARRMTGLSIDPNAWGGLLVVAFLLQLGFLAVRKVRTRWMWTAEATNALLLLVGLALTLSRSGWLALVVGTTVLVWLVRRRLTWKRAVTGAIAVGSAGVLVWWLAGDALMPLLKDALRSATIDQRWGQITGGLRAFRSSPIWGIGLDAYRRLGGTQIIHNTYIWFLVEMGIIGLIALLSLLTRVAAFAAMLGLALGIEATYQRHLWFLFALAEGLRQSTRPGGSPAGSSSPRILFVTTVAGTLRAFLIPHMQMLQERGWHVEAAARFGNSSKGEQLIKAGFTAHRIPFHRHVLAGGNLLAIWRLWRLIQTGRYDIVHVHTPVAAMVGRLAARLTRPRPAVLYTAHGFHFHRGAPWYHWLFLYPAEWLAGRWTDGLIVMNEEDVHNGRRLGFVQEENLFFVHGVGVDIDWYGGAAIDGRKVRSELGLSPDDVLITCIAEFTRGKNHKLLLDTWQRVTGSQANAHLLLVGGGPYLREVKRRLDSWESPRVHLAGHRADIPSVLRATDVLVLSSRREGLPRCIMEAMAAGRPVVATSARGSRDLIEHGVNGLLVEREDVAGLAEALVTLIQDPGLRFDMGKRGREKIKEYALDRVLDEMWLIYDRFRQLGTERAINNPGRG